jgi:hypothetical protein
MLVHGPRRIRGTVVPRRQASGEAQTDHVEIRSCIDVRMMESGSEEGDG